MSDVAFVAPIELPFHDGELAVQVRPANVATLALLLKRGKGLLDEVMSLPPSVVGGLLSSDPTHEDVAYIVTMLCDRGELGIDLVAIASGIDRDRVAAMLPDRFVYLAALVVQVNADFFGRAGPVFRAAAERFKVLGASASGPEPSTI